MNRPATILILDNSFTFGGAINSLQYLLGALDRQKFTPVLISGQPAPYLSSHFDCRWYRFRPKLPWVDNSRYLRIAADPLFRRRFMRKLLNATRFFYWMMAVTLPEAIFYYRVGRRHHADLVHLNNHLNSQPAGILAAKMLRIPCVAHLRDFVEVDVVTKCYASLIEHHVAISKAVDTNMAQLGIAAAKRTLVHDALDLSTFDPKIDNGHVIKEFNHLAKRPRYGLFCRLVDWKGVREFIQAACCVARDVPEAVGFIVGGHSDGDAAFVKQMHALAVSSGVADRLVFTGYRNDIPAMMKFMDVVVHASNSPEPFGMVIIEGMAMGRPVVATNGGGTRDILIHGWNGYLVEMGDGQGLGAAVVRLLRRPDMARTMGRHGRQHVESVFSAQRYANQMEKIFQQARR